MKLFNRHDLAFVVAVKANTSTYLTLVNTKSVERWERRWHQNQIKIKIKKLLKNQ